MDEKAKQEILEKAKTWWREELATAHERNTLKLTKVEEFSLNPFLWTYLAYYLEGNSDPESLARVLIYPRVLGTSITTSFGTGFQKLITKLFEGILGSQIPGIDLEFIDKTDGRKKYCQVKSGPNIVNYDDVKTIKDHFGSASRIARTNHLDVNVDDYLFCLLYGEPWQKNANIRLIEQAHTVVIGKEFWHRFTGDPDFYSDLVNSIGEVANEFNMKEKIKVVISELARDIKNKYPDLSK